MHTPISPKQRKDDLILAAIIAAAWLAIMGVAMSTWLRPWPDVLLRADFVAFWSAGAMVRSGDGGDLFDLEAQRTFQNELRNQIATTDEERLAADHSPFYNAPAMALVFVPLSYLPLALAYALWAGASAAMLAVSVALQLRGSPWAASLTAGFMSAGGVAATLFEGQVNAVFALTISLGLVCLRLQRPVAGGILLGLVWVKPQYAAVIALVLLVKGRWRELSGMSLSGLVVGALSLAVVGLEGIAGFLALLGQVGGFHAPAGFRISPEAMVNWRALLLNLWPGISEPTGYWLMLALAGATVGLSLFVWRGAWMPSGYEFGVQVLFAVGATLMASPHSHFHGTVLLLPPLALALSDLPGGATLRRAWRSMLIGGLVLSLVAFPLREISLLFVPYLIVAMMMLGTSLGRSGGPSTAGAGVTA